MASYRMTRLQQKLLIQVVPYEVKFTVVYINPSNVPRQ